MNSLKMSFSKCFFTFLIILSIPASLQAQQDIRSDSLLTAPDSIVMVKEVSFITGTPENPDSVLLRMKPFPFEEISDSIHPIELDSLMRINGSFIDFTHEEAIRYLSEWYNNPAVWNSADDPLREAIGRYLYEANNRQFYVSEWYINDFDWERIKIPSSHFFVWDTVRIILPSRDTLLPVALSDTTANLADFDSLQTSSDSLQSVHAGQLVGRHTSAVAGDSIILIISDTLKEVISTDSLFPFTSYDYPMTGDSIQAAMRVVRDYVHEKDSSMVVFIGSSTTENVWLSNGPNRMARLWLKNDWGEELSLWIGSPSRDSVSLVVEKGVHFRRPNKETRIADARIDLHTFDSSTLADPKKIDFKPQRWKFLSEASFVFNQALIKNWSKGGESNISTLMDLTGTLDYTNKEKKMTWNTVGRFKYGLQVSDEYGLRKNTDLIDINSKYNDKAFGKFDFSATLIFKTQLARGYKYPNDSVVVSKFFNPASITIGLGLDYKPNKNTSINFAPLSYKGTFVPDTSHIDQTKHGLAEDQRSKHEPGMSAQVKHKMELFKKVNITNQVRFFTNYIHNPLNVDIDWEMIATAKLNWFTDIRLNTHLIYDDDTLIPVTDKEGEPVLGSDGLQKKVPRIQFKEIIGVSVIFRF